MTVSEDRLAALRRDVESPPPGFDFDEAAWREAGQRFLDLAASVSTGWDEKSAGAPNRDSAADAFADPLSPTPIPLDYLLNRMERDVLPGSALNGHPRWFAYITASPTPIGVLGSLAASALNQNVGLWRIAPAAAAIEQQTLGWIVEMLGMPELTEGIFVSGGQMANIVAHTVIRDVKVPWDVHEHGMRGPSGRSQRFRVYASEELHYCHQQAMDLLGMGRDSVREVPAGDDYRMRLDSLAQMIAEDRERGDLPIAVVATAGTVGTGAVDPIPELLTLARTEDLWLHVDGAYGAFAALAAQCPTPLKALAEADSVACDPHKWLYQPIDAGVVLVREPGLLERSFAYHPSFLETAERGPHVDFIDRGPENSRPQRALKVWLNLQACGREGYAAMIDYNIRLAAYMEGLIRFTATLKLAAPRELSIVCWRVEPPNAPATDLNVLQLAIIDELERRGIAMVSNVTLRDGRPAIRACITNFRTRADDVEAVVRASAEIGAELSG